VNMEPANSR